MRTLSLRACIAAAIVTASSACAYGQSSVAEFYRGKQVRIIVGFAAGGNSGLYGDVLGRHLGKHLPGSPTFVPQYMPGGGGLVAANHMASRAARDGTEIAITSRTAAFEPLLGNKQAQFNARAFNWLGSANIENSVCIADVRQPVKTFDDVQRTELVIGGSGADAIDMIFPRVANRLLRRPLQDRQRLQYEQRYPSGHGAGRSARLLRHRMGLPEDAQG